MLKAMLNRNNISTILFVGISSAIIISGISGCSSSAGEAGSQATVKGATVENAKAQNPAINEVVNQTFDLLKEECKEYEGVNIEKVIIILPEQFSEYRNSEFPSEELLINMQTKLDDRKNSEYSSNIIGEGYIFLATITENGKRFYGYGAIGRKYSYQKFEIIEDTDINTRYNNK